MAHLHNDKGDGVGGRGKGGDQRVSVMLSASVAIDGPCICKHACLGVGDDEWGSAYYMCMCSVLSMDKVGPGAADKRTVLPG